jgi:hypothetical protein
VGQLSRQGRATRFVREFNGDRIKNYGLKAGDVLTVEATGLSLLDDNECKVMDFIRVCGPGPAYTRYDLTEAECHFDPEQMYREDMIERVVKMIGCTEEEAHERLVKAKLLPE